MVQMPPVMRMNQKAAEGAHNPSSSGEPGTKTSEFSRFMSREKPEGEEGRSKKARTDAKRDFQSSTEQIFQKDASRGPELQKNVEPGDTQRTRSGNEEETTPSARNKAKTDPTEGNQSVRVEHGGRGDRRIRKNVMDAQSSTIRRFSSTDEQRDAAFSGKITFARQQRADSEAAQSNRERLRASNVIVNQGGELAGKGENRVSGEVAVTEQSSRRTGGGTGSSASDAYEKVTGEMTFQTKDNMGENVAGEKHLRRAQQSHAGNEGGARGRNHRGLDDQYSPDMQRNNRAYKNSPIDPDRTMKFMESLESRSSTMGESSTQEGQIAEAKTTGQARSMDIPGFSVVEETTTRAAAQTADKSGAESQLSTAQAAKQATQSAYETIVKQARFMRNGDRSQVTIRLNPPELGRMKVDINMVRDKLSVDIQVENAELREALQHNIQQLERTLQEGRYDAQRTTISDMWAGDQFEGSQDTARGQDDYFGEANDGHSGQNDHPEPGEEVVPMQTGQTVNQSTIDCLV